MPGFRGAEGKEKGKGFIVRWGLEEAQSKSAGVASRFKRDFMNPAFTGERFCVLPREISSVPWEVACDRNWLSVEESALTAGEKSAEGKVVLPEGETKARTVSPRGDEKRGREPA